MKIENNPNSEAFGRLFNIIDRKLDVRARDFWLSQHDHYRDLPKGTNAGRKLATNFVTQTAVDLLRNPRDIAIANQAWRRREMALNHAQTSDESFSERVRKEQIVLMEEKGQLAGLVRVYANKAPSEQSARESAKDLLTDYFKSKTNLNQRISAYYNFVSEVLDLADDDEAFIEGVRIALFATDIIPKDPKNSYLAEQVALLEYPYNQDTATLQKLLVARRVIGRVSHMDKWSLKKDYQYMEDVLEEEDDVKVAVNRRKDRVTIQIGRALAGQMSREMIRVRKNIVKSATNILVEVKKGDAKKITVPFDLAHNRDDPLNQKFQAFWESRSRSDASTQSSSEEVGSI